MGQSNVDGWKETVNREMAFLHQPLFPSTMPEGHSVFVATIRPSWPLDDEWDKYADGYKQAGDSLVESLPKSEWQVNQIVFPVLFLYRHYIELRLKELLRKSGELLDSTTDVPKEHSLRCLWKLVRPRIETILGSKEVKHDSDAVEARIHELDAVDPNSIEARYPDDGAGNPTLKSIAYVDLGHLRDVVNDMSYVLDGASSALVAQLDLKYEVEAEYRNEARYY